MCVQDYITWVAIKKNFEVISHIEQARAIAQRSVNLAVIERDDSAVVLAESYKAEIETAAKRMDEKVNLVAQQIQVLSDELYNNALFEQAKLWPKPTRHDTIAKVQGIELRINIAKAVAIERTTSETCAHIKALQNEHQDDDGFIEHY